ncbi:MAG: LysM peptidoglycan-binding domain-containing protein [Spirochaetaceae bacterium]|jgi:hypothetical protein|nr:LysM peptidoglycan-binding domain-containing protein [Spirochaetaceae bacterium]
MMRIWKYIVLLALSTALWGQEQENNLKATIALRNNEYFQECLKQRSLARYALEEGEYDKSAWHSSEAERFAKLSDEYISRRLLLMRVSREIQAAADRLAWARACEAETYFPTQLKNAEVHYSIALDLRTDNDLAGALENALAVQRDLAAVAEPPKRDTKGEMIIPEDLPKKPNQYTVRPWDRFGDCFWNIAARFYGNPRLWPALYEANKQKLPDIDNPNLIDVGTVIEIPEIGTEKRTGMYDTGKPYHSR